MKSRIGFTLMLTLFGLSLTFAQERDSLVIIEREILISGDSIVEDVILEEFVIKENPSDTTKIKLNRTTVTIVNDDDENNTSCWGWGESQKYSLTWWNGIDLGVNGILSDKHDFNLDPEVEGLEPDYGKSRYISFNFAQIKGSIVGDYLGLTTGLTFQFYSWKYDGENEFIINGDSLLIEENTSKNITKNKLRTTYIGIPLMLEYNTSENAKRAFHISAGVIGKVLIGSMYKQKYNQDGHSYKVSTKGELGFNRVQVDALARIGYRRLTLFAQVGLLPLFDNNNTPDLYSFSTGFFIKV